MVERTRTGREIIDGGLFQPRMGVALLSVFGLLALGLASIGLYGIMAYSVNQRKREIGLRMALGAARASVLRLILKQGMSLVLTGVLIGFAAALLVGRLLSRMLYGVSASDPISVGGSGPGAVGRRAVGVLSAGAVGQPRRSAGGLARRMTNPVLSVQTNATSVKPAPAMLRILWSIVFYWR